MKLKDIVERLELEVLTETASLDIDIRGGYASDLLSDVIANSREGDLWITLQTHQNVIAVAKLKDLCGILLIGGRKPDPATLAKAEEENVPVVGTTGRTFETSGKIYGMLKGEESTV